MYKAKFLFITIGLCLTLSFCSKPVEVVNNSQQHIDIVKTIHGELVKGNIDIFDKYLDSNYTRYCQAMPPELQTMHGTEKLKLFIKDFLSSVTNYSDTIGPIFANENMVAYISTMKATNSGSMNGLPPTGKDFEIVNIVMHRFENDKIVESWVSWDNVAVHSQLGLFPPK